LDATTGALAWTTFPVKNDRPGGIDEDHPTFLLGVAGDSLIATGRGVWWINLAGGNTGAIWPEPSREGEQSYGRGLLAGGCIYWPTREQIIVLDQQLYGAGGVRVLDRVQLTRPDTDDRVGGGNLIARSGMLVIAARNRLFAFTATESTPKSPTREKK
ncbi:MAG: hypothetical protein K8T25_09920, partial [Planctomycetia bacterium]|nr:hypothetical protein [Planctomycetia bacterium]